jgi:hypothetical protein
MDLALLCVVQPQCGLGLLKGGWCPKAGKQILVKSESKQPFSYQRIDVLDQWLYPYTLKDLTSVCLPCTCLHAT